MNSWTMENPRYPLGSSRLANPSFQFLHSFMHYSAFKLVLNDGTYETTILKGDILHYDQGLIKSLQENAKLVTASFHSELPGEKQFKDH